MYVNRDRMGVAWGAVAASAVPAVLDIFKNISKKRDVDIEVVNPPPEKVGVKPWVWWLVGGGAVVTVGYLAARKIKRRKK